MAKIKAPPAFLNRLEEGLNYTRQLAEMLVVSTEWILKADSEALETQAKHLNLNEDSAHKTMILAHLAANLSNVAWGEFRIMNWDNEFGKADSLHFDEHKKTISIRKSPLEYVKDAMNLFRKDNPEIKTTINIKEVKK